MRPEDIIADWLHKLKRRHVREWSPDDAARELIDLLDREGLVIDYPMDEDCC